MKARLKIGDFAKLNGITIKTILYYHRIGLLGEPERTTVGYRLYGVEELNRVISIKRLKNLGLNLKQIRGILGCSEDNSSFLSTLVSLQTELKSQIQILQDRLCKIQKLIEQEDYNLNDHCSESISFDTIIEILGEEASEAYQTLCPELYSQEKRLSGLIDDLEPGAEYQALIREVAEYFNDYPDQFQLSLLYGEQISSIANLPLDSPIIEELAHNYVAFIRSLPFCSSMIDQSLEQKDSFEPMLNDLFGEVLTPAQMRFVDLLRQLLISAK